MNTPRQLALYEFGPFLLDTGRHLLLLMGHPVPLKPKVFDLLLVFAESGGRLLRKEELIATLWPDSFVEDNNLTVSISALRRILAAGEGGESYIETVPRLGYRFTAEVRSLQTDRAEQNASAERSITIDDKRGPVIEIGPNGVQTASIPDEADSQHIVSGDPPSTGIPGRSGKLLKSVAAVLLAVLVLATLGMVVRSFKFSTRTRSIVEPAVRISKPNLRKFTQTGNIKEAAVSPAGNLVVMVVEEGGKRSLWVKQTATESMVQILPPAEARHSGLTISPDGNFVYYLTPQLNSSHTLYRLPILGGAQMAVLTGVDSPISFSADGKSLAFMRRNVAKNTSSIMIANIDGGAEEVLATRVAPEFFSNTGPAWSPDGKVIACVVGSVSAGIFMKLVALKLPLGTEKLITGQDLAAVGRGAWLSDGSGLIVTAADHGSTSNRQLWHISYPDGKARKITQEVNDYNYVSLTSDSNALVTVQRMTHSSIWLIDNQEDPDKAVQINPNRYTGRFGLSWTPDDRILYVSADGVSGGIAIMNADGSNPMQLTGGNEDGFQTVCPDGRTVFFVSYRTGTPHIWKLNLDNLRQQQLTYGKSEVSPQCTPDGKFLVYLGVSSSGARTLWKMPVEGGTPVQLTDKNSRMPAISPDGNIVACYYLEGEPDPRWSIALIPIAGGPPARTIDKPPAVNVRLLYPPLRWTPDGKGLTFVDNQNNGVSNIWFLPLEGGEPKQITNFTQQQVFFYDWSKDGRKLAVSRGSEISDVVIMTNLDR